MTQVRIPAGTIVKHTGEVHMALKGNLEVRHSIEAALLDNVSILRAVEVDIHGLNFIVTDCHIENGVIIQTHKS